MGGGGGGGEGARGGRELRDMERKVAALWSGALGLPAHVPLKSADSFFLCGGDSLAALRYVSFDVCKSLLTYFL